MDPIIQLRFRQTVAILIAALVTAAAVRHFAHFDGRRSFHWRITRYAFLPTSAVKVAGSSYSNVMEKRGPPRSDNRFRGSRLIRTLTTLMAGFLKAIRPSIFAE